MFGIIRCANKTFLQINNSQSCHVQNLWLLMRSISIFQLLYFIPVTKIETDL